MNTLAAIARGASAPRLVLGELLRDLSGRDDHPGVLPDVDEDNGAIRLGKPK